MPGRRLSVIAAVLLLAVAGCSSSQGSQEPTATPTPTLTITAEEPSPGIRYADEVFDGITTQRDVVYGSSTTQAGAALDLTMDVLEPAGDDATDRPLVILAHGGGFTSGDKLEMSQFFVGPMLARSGYVVAAINYRLVDVPASAETIERGVIDAVHDMKAAVRYFRASAADGNPYGIDQNEIFIGGYSAGAFTSLHAGYLDSVDEVAAIDPRMAEYLAATGGIEGESGNAGYSSDVAGVISISGALVDTELLDRSEPPLFSIHGTADNIVPFEEGEVLNLGVITQGSGLIHQRADEEGVPNTLVALPDIGHFPFLACAGCDEQLRGFLVANLN